MGTDALSDPTSANALVAAVRWVEQAMLGTIATSIAAVAVGYIGLLMLTGRLPIRRGLAAIMGCFVITGSTAIVAALEGVANSSSAAARYSMAPAQLQPPTPVVVPPIVYDPYAGASVPVRSP